MPNDNTGGWPDAEREAVEWALAVHFSQNRQPCMSGDPRDRLSSLQRRKMEDARDAVLGALAPLITAREAAAMAMRDAAAEEADFKRRTTDNPRVADAMEWHAHHIRALPLPAAAQAALDAVVQAAVEREREACAAMFDANALWAEAAIAAAIRARREVGMSEIKKALEVPRVIRATPAAPVWCNYPEPTRPLSGCWSLLRGDITERKDCGDCECAAAVEQEARDAG